MINKKARIIAFYLPQFHPIPENDKWWGKGFTEWTNVGKAKPLFKGHYQPRVPADLGYYDLRIPEVRDAQAEMARNAGIEGFMYWHYWFGNGKRLLEKPFQEVLKSGKPDFPFCLGWANHSWCNHTWSAAKQYDTKKFIAEQTYPGKDDYIKHFNTLLPAFKDHRYITVDGNPIFLIYDPFAIPDINNLFSLWKRLAIENGLNGIHFVGLASGWTDSVNRVLAMGFNAVAPSNLWTAEAKAKGRLRKLILHKIRNMFPDVCLDKYSYGKIIRHLFVEEDRMNNAYPSIIPQWDRSPRSGKRAVIYHGSTPELFKKHVKDALSIVSNKPAEKRILFLRSWNEWGEGNYMEPDLRMGYGYLNALKSCLEE